MQPVIAHIDMNSYFASCEQQDNPAWRGKPLGVCEHLGGIIIAPSIEAKRWGIKTAMPVWEARKLYPKIILTQTNPDRYRFYTRRFLKVFADYTDRIEKYSIDEAFLNLTKACNIRVPVYSEKFFPLRKRGGVARRTGAVEITTPSLRLRSAPPLLEKEGKRWVHNPLLEKEGKKQVHNPLLEEEGKKQVHNPLLVRRGQEEVINSNPLPTSPTSLHRLCPGLSANTSRGKGVTYEYVDPWEEAQRIAREIKTRMKTEVGDWLTCSVGISYSKLVAKIASDLQKPDGLVVVRPEDKNSLYERLALTDIPGIGNRQERNLNALGIMTLKDLRDYPLTKLVTHFGIAGYHLHSMGQLQGSWKESFGDEVVNEPMKSIGHMYTVPIEYRSQRVLRPVLYKLSEMVAARLRANGLMGNTIHVHAYNGNEVSAGRGAKVGYYTQDGRQIYLEALALLRSTGLLNEVEKNTYFVGVTISGLVAESAQASLFDDLPRRQRLSEALDKINEKYTDFTVARVPAFLARDIIRDSVGFGRMKEFTRTPTPGSFQKFQ